MVSSLLDHGLSTCLSSIGYDCAAHAELTLDIPDILASENNAHKQELLKTRMTTKHVKKQGQKGNPGNSKIQ